MRYIVPGKEKIVIKDQHVKELSSYMWKIATSKDYRGRRVEGLLMDVEHFGIVYHNHIIIMYMYICNSIVLHLKAKHQVKIHVMAEISHKEYMHFLWKNGCTSIC